MVELYATAGFHVKLMRDYKVYFKKYPLKQKRSAKRRCCKVKSTVSKNNNQVKIPFKN